MSDHDEFDEIFGDFTFVSRGKRDTIDDSAMGGLPQLEAEDDEIEDELILGTKVVTYLLYAPGRDLQDFTVTAREAEIEVKTPDFAVKKNLTARLDPSTAKASYRNGVLSLRVRRTTRKSNGRA